MKKAIKALWHGIKSVFTAVVDWAATLFGMKDNSKYGRVLRRIIGTAFAVGVVLWAAIWLIRFGRNIGLDECELFSGEDNDVYLSEQYSDNVFFYDGFYGEMGYIANAKGKKLIKPVAWTASPMEGDSLVCYSDGEHRGYFHMRDGRLVVKPTYDHAWVFSEGVAAVESKGKIKFINTDGQVVIENNFAYDDNVDGYVFHKGHCAVHDSTGSYMGLIDKKGNWVIPPQYENISPIDTFWIISTENGQSVLNYNLETVMPHMQVSFEIRDTCIIARLNNHTVSTYTKQGKLITANQISDVEQLMYDTKEITYRDEQHIGNDDEYYYTDEYYARKAVATCLKYEAECGWYGLMSSDGRQITPPAYSSIEAVDKDLYLCKTDYGRGIVLNSKGQRVE